MAASINSFSDLDQRRAELELNVAKLANSLKHWQTWEAEYEGFKEELEAAGKSLKETQILRIASDFNGELLTEPECNALVNDKDGSTRTPEQIFGILNRRLDYVRQNVKTAQKKHDLAATKLSSLVAVVDAQPRDEDGMPLQEIMEELDDDDNVISSTVADHGASAPHILDALRRQGVRGIPSQSSHKVQNEAAHQEESGTEKMSLTSPPGLAMKTAQKPKGTKTVRFKNSNETSPSNFSVGPGAPSNQIPEDMSAVHQDVVESFEKEFPRDPTIPQNESPEQAALRREMLQYNMTEVGAIVAEMSIDDEDDGLSETFSGEEEEEEDDGDEPEDSYGRVTVPVIDEAYRQEMLELEHKLSARYIANTGPSKRPDGNTTKPSSSTTRQEHTKSGDPQEASADGQRKGVRFAETLDIQSPSPPKPEAPGSDTEPQVTPLTDNIIERDDFRDHEAGVSPPKPSSRFMSGRARVPPASNPNRSKSQTPIPAGPLAGLNTSSLTAIGANRQEYDKIIDDGDDAKNGNLGAILADQLVEKPMEDVHSNVQEPDELDPQLLQQQVATEYHRMRNRLIQRNGGFKASEDDDEMEDDEEPKKSRFMAARVSKINR